MVMALCPSSRHSLPFSLSSPWAHHRRCRHNRRWFRTMLKLLLHDLSNRPARRQPFDSCECCPGGFPNDSWSSRVGLVVQNAWPRYSFATTGPASCGTCPFFFLEGANKAPASEAFENTKSCGPATAPGCMHTVTDQKSGVFFAFHSCQAQFPPTPKSRYGLRIRRHHSFTRFPLSACMMEAGGAVSWPDGLVPAALLFFLSFHCPLDVFLGLGMLENNQFGRVVSSLV